MKIRAMLSALLLALVTVPAVATAQEGGVATEERVHSVNLSPLGVLFGSYSINYEHLFNNQHGLLVEGQLSSSKSSDSSNLSGGAGVGYRWHWSQKQDSGFLGANIAYGVGNGTGTVTSGDSKKTFDVSTTATTFTFNIGKRWEWQSGFNVTFRVGAGKGIYTVETTSTDPDAKSAVKLVNDLLEFLPVALDGELSAGLTF